MDKQFDTWRKYYGISLVLISLFSSIIEGGGMVCWVILISHTGLGAGVGGVWLDGNSSQAKLKPKLRMKLTYLGRT